MLMISFSFSAGASGKLPVESVGGTGTLGGRFSDSFHWASQPAGSSFMAPGPGATQPALILNFELQLALR